MTVAGGQRDLDAVRSGLERWLRASRPDVDGVRVAPLRKPIVRLLERDAPRRRRVGRAGRVSAHERLVARLPPAGGGIFPVYDLTRQARVQPALAGRRHPRGRAGRGRARRGMDRRTVLRHAARSPASSSRTHRPSSSAVRSTTPNRPCSGTVQRDFVDTPRGRPPPRLGRARPRRAHAARRPRRSRTTSSGPREYLAWAGDGDAPTGARPTRSTGAATTDPDPEPPLSLVWGDPRLGNVVYDAGVRGGGAARLGDGVDRRRARSTSPGSSASTRSCVGGDRRRPARDSWPRTQVLDEYASRLGARGARLPWFEVFEPRPVGLDLPADPAHAARPSGLDEPWLRGPTPGQQRIAELIS